MAGTPGRVLGIDYGLKRFGLAISDELGVTARPLSTFARTNRRDDLRRLRLLAREHGVRCIVVGLPLHLDGAESEMATEASRFATRLAQHLGLPVELADERLTSWEAAQHAPTKSRAHGEPRKSGKRATHDDVAAAIILREYLAAQPQSRKRAPATRAKT
jgi:putative holliday junction resolvase